MSPLIVQLLLLQLGLPLLLIGLHALVKTASLSGWCLRTIAILLVLIFTARAGVWLFPPWWTPWFLGVLHVWASAVALSRYRRGSSAHARWFRITERVSALILCALSLWWLLPAFDGSRPPAEAVALSAPLAPGRYLVTSGGQHEAINAHLKTRVAERFRAYRGQSYAIDLIEIDRWGLRAIGVSPVDPGQYFIYGRTVTAPCAGTVAVAVDGIADMPVPRMDREHMLGNHVIIKCKGVFVVLAHLAPESVLVAYEQSVQLNDPVGAVGNTGNTGEPHLHMHVQASLPDDEPVSADPLWFTLDNRFLVRNDVLQVE